MKILTYYAILYVVSIMSFPFEKTIKVYRFLNCTEYRHLPTHFEGVRFVPVRRMYYISAKLVVTRNIRPNLKLILKFERCKSREHLDSCEPYQDINIKSACQRTLSKFKAWSAFVEKMEPSLGCPLLKGTYSCQNGTFDGIALAVLPIEGWYWKVRAFVYEEGVKNSGPIMCVYVEGEIVNV